MIDRIRIKFIEGYKNYIKDYYKIGCLGDKKYYFNNLINNEYYIFTINKLDYVKNLLLFIVIIFIGMVILTTILSILIGVLGIIITIITFLPFLTAFYQYKRYRISFLIIKKLKNEKILQDEKCYKIKFKFTLDKKNKDGHREFFIN